VVDLTAVDPAVRRAVEAARGALLESPDSAAAWGKLGMVLRTHGLPVAASNACFAQAERLDPRQPRWPYLQASALWSTEPDAALPKLQRAVDLCDCVPDAPRLQLGEMLLERGRLEEAAQQFQRVLRHDPENVRAGLGLGRIAFERGELTQSISYLDHARAVVHTGKAAHILLAQAYERLGDKPKAEQELRQANELPNDTAWPDPFLDELLQYRVGRQALLARADHLIHQGQYAKSLQVLKRTVQEYPDAPWAWVMMGRAYQGLKDLPASERALQKATELGPDLPEAHFYLGVAFFLQKNYAAATTRFRKATDLKPDFALAHFNLGHSLKEQGDETAAMSEFRTAINCQPNYAPAHVNLAEILIKKGQRDEALVHLRHAVELDPSNKKAKELLKQIREEGGGPAGP
jgi:tetratricopeptide (TPR) repeat protein